MKIRSTLFIALITTLISLPAFADTGRVFGKRCEDFKSSKEFVKQASVYCLTQGNSISCEREAGQYFKNCNFEGNYHSLLQQAHTDLFLMFVLAKAPAIAQNQNVGFDRLR